MMERKMKNLTIFLSPIFLSLFFIRAIRVIRGFFM